MEKNKVRNQSPLSENRDKTAEFVGGSSTSETNISQSFPPGFVPHPPLYPPFIPRPFPPIMMAGRPFFGPYVTYPSPVMMLPPTRPLPIIYPQQTQSSQKQVNQQDEQQKQKISKTTPPTPLEKAQKKEEVQQAEESDQSKVELQKERIEQLRNLLIELKTPKFASYDRVLPKLMYDQRFTNIPKEDRRSSFASALRLLRDNREKSDAKDKRAALVALQSFLKELNTSNKLKSSFSVADVVQRFSDDPSWPVELDVKARDYAIEEILEERRSVRARRDEEDRSTFKQLVEEYLDREKINCTPKWYNIKRELRDDPRYVVVDSEERESLFFDVLKGRGLVMTDAWHEGRNYKEKEFESGNYRSRPFDGRRLNRPLRESERKYGRDEFRGERCKRGAPLEPIEESRDAQRRRIADQQAKETLRQLLTERIKNPFTMSPREAWQLLERDTRWEEVSQELGDSRKFEIYNSFVNDLKNQRLDLLEKELSRTDLINGPNVSFTEAAELLGWDKDRRYQGISLEEVEGRFIRWRRRVLEEAKRSFSTFLRTNALIAADTPDHGPGFRDLMAQLSDDLRYRRLDGYSEVRDQLVVSWINELKRLRKETPKPPI